MTPPSKAPFTLPAVVRVLREATREAHDRLDASSPVFAPSLDLRSYHDILGLYLAAHHAVECALEPWSPALDAMGVSLDVRRKVPALRRDRQLTAALLATADTEEIAALPFALPTLASAWGALYVMEGSSLGGQHILRTLESSPLALDNGLTPSSGLAYFSGYGGETGEMWRELLRALGAADAADPDGRDAIIDGARATFALFETTLSVPGAVK